MGPRSHQMDLLVLISLAAIAVGVVVPTYSKVVAKLTACGVGLSWLGHFGVFALAVLLGLAGLVLIGVVSGAITGVIYRFSRPPDEPA